MEQTRDGATRSRAAPLSQGSVREHNLGLVLGVVAGQAGLSRAEVAAASGLTRATVSSLVESLLAAGLVEETGPAGGSARAGAGRPATGLALAARTAGLGVEVNVDYVATCLLDLTGQVRRRELVMGEHRGSTPARTLRSAAVLASKALARAKDDGLHVVGACIAVPGLVSAPDGPLVVAPNLGWHDVDVLATLRRDRRLTGLRMTLDNEANCAAVAELVPPGSRGRSLLYVSGEIGVGAAIVVGGELLRGTHGWSGEIGHLTVDPDGPPCTCGARGCLEQYAGQEAILRAAGADAAVTTSSAPTSSVARIVELAQQGSAEMLDALGRAGRALGIALSAAVNLLDVGEVVLGGSLHAIEPWVRADLVRELDRRVLSRPWAEVTVRPSLLATDAAVTGAAASVVHAVVEDPARWGAVPVTSVAPIASP